MSTELVSPSAETENPAPEVEVTTPEAVAKPEAEDEPKGDDPAKAIERMQRRIDKKHAAAAAAKAEVALLRQELEELRGKPKDDAEKDVRAQAEAIAEARLYAKSADEIVSKGKAQEKDFLAVLGELAAEVGPFVQKDNLPSKFMRAVLDVSESPHELLYHLGKNPELAADLADLPVTKLAARLDRIERELKDKATPKTSSAPKPLEPVKATGSNVKDPQNMTYKEFVKWRRQSIAERR